MLVYQMLVQQSPFRGEDKEEIYDAILRYEPLYPIHMPRDSVALMQQLLVREPERRLGSGPEDALEVMRHPFFKGIDWDDLYHKRIPVPFLPQLNSDTDTSNFDNEFTSVTPALTPVQSGKSSSTERLLLYNEPAADVPLLPSTQSSYARRISRILSCRPAMTNKVLIPRLQIA